VDDQIFRSDNEGSIKLQLDEDLLKKDPQVTLEERPLSVDFFD
jgi:hypothetical protein